jgi:hypothetical protein
MKKRMNFHNFYRGLFQLDLFETVNISIEVFRRKKPGRLYKAVLNFY